MGVIQGLAGAGVALIRTGLVDGWMDGVSPRLWSSSVPTVDCSHGVHTK